MKTNAFDIRRFWQTLKWTVLSERKGLITIAVGFLVAFLAIQLFSCFTIFDLTAGLGHEAAVGGIIACLGVVSFMRLYYASGVLGNARESRQRTTVLMLPASNLEKFAARLVLCLVLIPLLLKLMMLGATGLRMLFELMAGHSGITAGFEDPYTNIPLELSAYSQFIVDAWTFSLFVLGGVFFRHRPFVWTCVTLFAASLLLITFGLYFTMLIGEENVANFTKNSFSSMTWERAEIIFSIVTTLFTVFNVWLSYRLYCRLQVVQHKWFNV